jgi:hypothetical protein
MLEYAPNGDLFQKIQNSQITNELAAKVNIYIFNLILNLNF